jgi:hypothetical protein
MPQGSLKKPIEATDGKIGVLVADPQYSSRRLRIRISNHEIKPVIPCPSNQNPMEAEFPRVDKHFRTHGPEGLKRLYAHKASIERVVSRLKVHLSLENHKVKLLRNISIHALPCIIAMLLTALTPQNWESQNK